MSALYKPYGMEIHSGQEKVEAGEILGTDTLLSDVWDAGRYAYCWWGAFSYAVRNITDRVIR